MNKLLKVLSTIAVIMVIGFYVRIKYELSKPF